MITNELKKAQEMFPLSNRISLNEYSLNQVEIEYATKMFNEASLAYYRALNNIDVEEIAYSDEIAKLKKGEYNRRYENKLRGIAKDNITRNVHFVYAYPCVCQSLHIGITENPKQQFRVDFSEGRSTDKKERGYFLRHVIYNNGHKMDPNLFTLISCFRNKGDARSIAYLVTCISDCTLIFEQNLERCPNFVGKYRGYKGIFDFRTEIEKQIIISKAYSFKHKPTNENMAILLSTE